MKKVIGALTTFIIMGGLIAQGGTVRENCGCGLGTMALGDEEGIISHLAATILNGISGNQTFGVTSGTLGCDQSTTIVSNERIMKYVADNMDHLAFDIASGEGDSLDALADLMEVAPEKRAGLYVQLQQNFEKIFTSEEVSADDVVKNIARVI